LDAAQPAGGHGVFLGRKKLLDVEGLPGTGSAPVDRQVPDGLPAHAGAGALFMLAVSILQKASLAIFLYGLLATACAWPG